MPLHSDDLPPNGAQDIPRRSELAEHFITGAVTGAAFFVVAGSLWVDAWLLVVLAMAVAFTGGEWR